MKKQEQQILVIDINLTRGLVTVLMGALLVVALLGYLAWSREKAAASGLQSPLAASTGMRQYYLTTTSYDGANADGTDGNGAGVCASGYHFASLWEIGDPSNLKYNTTLGATQADAGQGPPSNMSGWVRTGYTSSSGLFKEGQDNCDAWTNNNSIAHGTTVQLAHDWSMTGTIFYVWDADWPICAGATRVWCVEN